MTMIENLASTPSTTFGVRNPTTTVQKDRFLSGPFGVWQIRSLSDDRKEITLV